MHSCPRQILCRVNKKHPDNYREKQLIVSQLKLPQTNASLPARQDFWWDHRLQKRGNKIEKSSNLQKELFCVL